MATRLGDVERVKQLVENGANPLDTVKDGDTLLHTAAEMGQLNILKYLIEDEGCNPATAGYQGFTTLHSAANNKQFEVVQYLVDQCQLDPSALDNNNRAPLAYACQNGDLEIVKYLIQADLTYMNKKDVLHNEAAHMRKTVSDPLCVACFHGQLPIVKYLVEEHGCDPSRQEGGDKSPLLCAVCGDHVRIVKYLAETCHVQAFSPTSEELSLVDIAVEHNRNLEMVKILTQSLHCDPNHMKDGITSLHSAAKLGDLSIVKYLCSLDKCDPNIRGWNGRQPIHRAAMHGHLNIVKYLVEEQDCNPSAQDDESGSTPLCLAASDGHLDIVRYLTLKHHCDPTYPAVYGSNTSLHVAAAYGHLHVLRFFIEVLKCDPNVLGKNKLTPESYARDFGHMNVAEYLRISNTPSGPCFEMYIPSNQDRQWQLNSDGTQWHVLTHYEHQNIALYMASFVKSSSKTKH